jgi:hypothetical protein
MPRIKFSNKKLLEERAKLIKMLSAEGWTDIEIGFIFKIDRTRVYCIRSKKK